MTCTESSPPVAPKRHRPRILADARADQWKRRGIPPPLKSPGRDAPAPFYAFSAAWAAASRATGTRGPEQDT